MFGQSLPNCPVASFIANLEPFGMELACCRRMSLTCSSISPSSAQPGDSVPILQCSLCRFVLRLIAPALLSACVGGGECNHGEVRCDANTARTCVASETQTVWQTEDCGKKACVVAKEAAGTTVAFCALSADPDPRCSEADIPNCAGNALVECTAGYATSTQSCEAGCLALDAYPDRCVGVTALDPQRCGPDGYVCAMARSSLYDDATLGSGLTPSGVCSEGTMPSTPGYVIYSQRCEDGSIVARTRCAQSCGLLDDCSTICQ